MKEYLKRCGECAPIRDMAKVYQSEIWTKTSSISMDPQWLVRCLSSAGTLDLCQVEITSHSRLLR